MTKPASKPTVKIVTWDWREQPGIGDLAAAVLAVSGGRVTIQSVETGSDQYALTVSGRELTAAEQQAAYQARLEGTG